MRPLDRHALVTLGVAAVVAVAASVAGDRVGLRVVSLTPARGAEQVSTLATIEVRFSEAIDPAARSSAVAIEPPVDGSLRWGSRTLRFDPDRTLSARTRYTVRLDGSVRAASGRRLRGPVEWSFDTGALRVAYVADGTAERTRIAARVVATGEGEPPAGGTPEAGAERTLASFERPVRDFHQSPDGGSLVVTLGTDVFAADLWLIDSTGGQRELLGCGGAECSAARWAPDGATIVFSRRRLPLPPRPWLLDPVTGNQWPLMEQEVIGFDPRWSDDGAWVAFVSPVEGGLRVVNVADGRTVLIPTRAAAPGSWRPGARQILTSDLREGAAGRAVDLLITIDLTDLTVRRALRPQQGADRAPVWAPGGDRFAFIRAAGEGEQVWLATDAGGPQFEAEPLAAAPGLTYREIVFAPGGELLAAQRSRLDVAFPEPEVVVFDLAGRELAVIAGAATPRWLP